MPTLGKAVWGPKGKAFVIVEAIEGKLEELTGKRAESGYANSFTREYERVLVVDGTQVRFSYNSSSPGYGTIRWRGRNATIEKVVREVAREHGIDEETIPFGKNVRKGGVNA